MKQRKEQPFPTPARPNRQELDAVIQGIGELIKKKPKTVAKVLELWVNEPSRAKNSETKKKAA